MRAVLCKGFGGPEVLHVASGVAIPTLPSPQHILLRVKATAVNRADTMQRKGHYPPPPGASEILGLEASGVVHTVGAEVASVRPGDRVMALLSGGGYADYVAVHAAHVMPIPASMSFVEAAAVTEVFLTAWQCLTMNMSVQPGNTVLLHAGASGVGTAAAQLCRKVLGARAVTTSSKAKVADCLRYADVAVSREPDEKGKLFVEKLKAALGEAPVINAVIDPVFGGGYLEETVEACAPDAAITVLAMMGGNTIPSFCATPLFRKRITLRFSTLRNRTDAYKADLVASFARRALPQLDAATTSPDQRLVPVICKTFESLEEVGAAHAMVDASETIGKVVLVVDKE